MTKTIQILDTITASIAILGCLLHVIGLYLLFTVKSSQTNRIQVHYLKYLSVTELLLCLGLGTVTILIMADDATDSSAFRILQILVYIMLGSMWYLIMITFTVDRFLAVYWSFKYPLYWSVRRANILCIAQCLFSSLLGAVAAVLEFAAHVEVTTTRTLWTVYMASNWATLGIVVAAYGYMFIKYKESVRLVSLPRDARLNADHNHNLRTASANTATSREHTPRSILTVFRGSRFWVATLIISTFILLVVIPDQVIYYFSEHPSKIAAALEAGGPALFCAECCIDAIIYILLSPHVRKLLRSKTKRSTPRSSDGSTPFTISLSSAESCTHL